MQKLEGHYDEIERPQVKLKFRHDLGQVHSHLEGVFAEAYVPCRDVVVEGGKVRKNEFKRSLFLAQLV